MNNRMFMFLSPIIMIAGGMLLWRSFSDNHEIEAAQSWPITRGVVADVNEKTVYVRRRYGSLTCYQITVSYNYSVNGKNYSAKQNRFMDRPYRSNFFGRILGEEYTYNLSDARQIERDFAKGTATAVYYDPKQPAVAYIDNKTTKGISLFTDQTMGIILAAVGLGGVLLHSAGFDQNR